MVLDALRGSRSAMTPRAQPGGLRGVIRTCPEGTGEHPRPVDRTDRRLEDLDDDVHGPAHAGLPGRPHRGRRRLKGVSGAAALAGRDDAMPDTSQEMAPAPSQPLRGSASLRAVSVSASRRRRVPSLSRRLGGSASRRSRALRLRVSASLRAVSVSASRRRRVPSAPLRVPPPEPRLLCVSSARRPRQACRRRVRSASSRSLLERSFWSAFDSIWRTRSRVTDSRCPISSRVYSRSLPRP